MMFFINGNRRLDSPQHILFQRPSHAADRLLPCPSSDRQLGQERVIVGRNRVVLIDGAVNSNADAARRQIGRDRSRARHEIIPRILGVDAALNGMALAR